MKKTLLYILIFLFGIAIGYTLFISKDNLKAKKETVENSYLDNRISIEEKKQDFIKSSTGMLGEVVIVNGEVAEAYKNRNNEVVLYIKDSQIPMIVNCTLSNSEMQVFEPISLGEKINLQGIFTKLDDEMYLEGCRLINRAPKER